MSIEATLTTSERMLPFRMASPDNDELPPIKMCRLYTTISDDGTFEEIDQRTGLTVDAGQLPRDGIKRAA